VQLVWGVALAEQAIARTVALTRVRYENGVRMSLFNCSMEWNSASFAGSEGARRDALLRAGSFKSISVRQERAERARHARKEVALSELKSSNCIRSAVTL
jgi:hypothetical protein